MKYKKIVLAGGNGYLGTVLAKHFKELADEVIILSRKPQVQTGNVKTLIWDGKTIGPWVSQLENADLLVNLCGKNVNCRYTQKNKAKIFASRLIPTNLLNDVVTQMPNPPKLWINVTSATIYRHAEDHGQDEETGAIGTGFSVDVCKQWEAAFFNKAIPGTRKIALHMGIVLGKNDGVFPRLRNLAKFGMGGSQGNGKQYVTWIHEQDVAHITEWLMKHPELNGIINCTAPEPVTNENFMKIIRQTFNLKIGLPAPKWLLEIGALMIGTETELILKSRWVLPKRLLDAGYKFKVPFVTDAVKACI